MKKLLLILLAMFMVFSMTACGSKTEESDQGQDKTEVFTDSIPVGDGVADLDITGKCFGDYEAVEPDLFEDGEAPAEGLTIDEYYCKDCDTPYIYVFSRDKEGKTLEEYTKENAEAYGDGYYLMTDEFGYYTGSAEKEDGFYYCSNLVYEGDEQFHAVCYYAKTEEVELGDNIYVYIPTGYTEKEYKYGTSILMGSYDESYALPNFRLSLNGQNYEDSVANFAYNGEADLTKEEYDKLSHILGAEDGTIKFFGSVGYNVIDAANVESKAGNVERLILENQRDVFEESFCALAYVGKYRLNLWCDGEMPAYPYMHVLIDSIHTK